jgi:hypothetical protein
MLSDYSRLSELIIAAELPRLRAREEFLMASNLPPLDIKADSLTPNSQYGAIQETPWSKWGWGLLVPLVFAGNVVVAVFAWFIVALVLG